MSIRFARPSSMFIDTQPYTQPRAAVSLLIIFCMACKALKPTFLAEIPELSVLCTLESHHRQKDDVGKEKNITSASLRHGAPLQAGISRLRSFLVCT